MARHNVINGIIITENGFYPARDMKGNYVMFRAKNGQRKPVQIGVTEFGVPDRQEFIRGENGIGLKSYKVPPHFILWLPEANERGGGVSINGQMYIETQKNPEQFPERVKKLEEYEVPLTIDCR